MEDLHVCCQGYGRPIFMYPRQGYGRPNRAEPADRRREGQREVICYKCGGKGHRRAQCPSYAGSTTSHLASSVDEADASRTTNSFSVHGVGGPSSKLAEVSLAVRPGVRTCARFCPAVADTGAECCVAGTQQLKMLNLKLSDLSKADGKIRHAGGGALKILGMKKCTLQLAHKTTVQKVYFIQGVERFFLSVAACNDLGLVDKNFPYHTQDGAVTAGAMTGDHDTRSNQPTPERSMPVRPKEIPLAPTEVNVPQLEKYLKQQFANTTFNREVAPLPAMNCAPHSIHLQPDAVPFARHTPIPVSKHWEEEVKAQLDEDERMGIIPPPFLGGGRIRPPPSVFLE